MTIYFVLSKLCGYKTEKQSFTVYNFKEQNKKLTYTVII